MNILKVWKLEIKWIKKKSEESDIAQDYIFQAWKKDFPHVSEEDFFITLYEERYRKLLEDSRRHRDKNFQVKAFYRYILYLFAGLQIILLISTIRIALAGTVSNIIEIATFSEAMLLAVTLTILLSLVKYVDVLKYQETWARTRQAVHSCRTEMVKYLEKLTPYSDENAEVRFKKRILEVLDRNREKFTRNLEDKEKGLLDELSILKR